MVCKNIIEILERQSPEKYACDWDNVGLLVGSKEKEIQRIYIALDADDAAIAEAVEVGADMLLTHHPMIFKGLKKVNNEDFIGRRVIELIKNDMAYYAMHTNFDITGMADLAAERMGLEERMVLQAVAVRMPEVLQEAAKTDDLQSDGISGKSSLGIGKIGILPTEESIKECVARVKKAFEVDAVKVFVNPVDADFLERPVRRIAICPGSGKSVIKDALQAGAQVLVTGDIDHHEGIDAAACGMTIIDAGHYGIEKIFIPYMKEYLERTLSGVEVIAQKIKQPFIHM